MSLKESEWLSKCNDQPLPDRNVSLIFRNREDPQDKYFYAVIKRASFLNNKDDEEFTTPDTFIYQVGKIDYQSQ